MIEETVASEPAGLRERKKVATRQALAEAALDLALDRGWHDFTIADVVEAVGVSRRTFSNYFTSKAECLAAASDAWLDEVLDTVQNAPVATPLDQVLQDALLKVSTEAPSRWERFIRVVTAEPELAQFAPGLDNVRIARVAEVIGARVARMRVLDADDPRIELLAMFSVHAGRLCLQRWLRGEHRDTEVLAAQLRTAFSLIDLSGLID